jgi:hypothetical protein
LVVVFLLVLFLLGPGVIAAEPIVCDYALRSGKVLDWLVCELVMFMIGSAYDTGGGVLLVYE